MSLLFLIFASRMTKGLSILIPTYNDCCLELVKGLQAQATECAIDFEILVADDGSTDMEVVRKNQEVAKLPHCRLIRNEQNQGRAVIRNLLAREAQYAQVLCIDSDMHIERKDFIARYLQEEAPVVYGGVTIGGTEKERRHNLRCQYEQAEAWKHTVDKRKENPYHDFHTANFMINRDIMLRHPFDERYRKYGYEDVAFGKVLKNHYIPICHIDNPMLFDTFEDNAVFISKTEEGLRTLYQFREELQDYSRLIRKADALSHPMLWLLRSWHRHFGKWERRLLVNCQLSIVNSKLFPLYKLGYYLEYAKRQ